MLLNPGGTQNQQEPKPYRLSIKRKPWGLDDVVYVTLLTPSSKQQVGLQQLQTAAPDLLSGASTVCLDTCSVPVCLWLMCAGSG